VCVILWHCQGLDSVASSGKMIDVYESVFLCRVLLWDHTSYPVGTKGSFPGCEAHHSPPPSAKVKTGGAVPPLPLISSWLNV
jgi:hypothetical protein